MLLQIARRDNALGGYVFGSIFGANVCTAILPFLIRNVSAANTTFADAQFACHTT